MTPKLLDVVIPTYHQAQNLDRILLNLVEIKDVNYIIVNDGSSTEDYETVLEKYKDYENIAYYYKENGGLSDARNYGIKQCTSEYIAFLDGDDIYVPTEFEKAISWIKATRKDAYMWDYYCLENNSDMAVKAKVKEVFFDFNKKMTDIPTPPAWMKVIKKDLLKKYDLSFRKIIFEDIDWSIRLLYHVHKIYRIPYPVYGYYLDVDNSIMNTLNKNKKMTDKSIQSIINYVDGLAVNEQDEIRLHNLKVFSDKINEKQRELAENNYKNSMLMISDYYKQQ